MLIQAFSDTERLELRAFYPTVFLSESQLWQTTMTLFTRIRQTPTTSSAFGTSLNNKRSPKKEYTNPM